MRKRNFEQRVHINPFTPDSPVEPALFAGRKEELAQISNALLNAHNNRAEHILVQGEHWIGKSSIALYAENMANLGKFMFNVDGISFLSCFSRIGACQTLDEVCVAILNSFKRAQNSVKIQIFDYLSRIKGLQLGPVGVQLAEARASRFIAPVFPSLLEDVLNKTKGSYTGVLVILDEVEAISHLEGSASLLKSTLEELRGNGHSNVMVLMCATPDAVDAFTEDHPSFPRLFRFVELPPLEENESKDLLEKALRKGQPAKKINKQAISFIHHYSDGFPGVLQELGYWAFEADTDSRIKKNDCIVGVLGTGGLKGALETLYDKHFRKMLQKDMLSERYRVILKTFATADHEVLSYKELRDQIDPTGEWQVGSYLGNLTKRGIVRHVPGERGKYKLASRMLDLWLSLEDLRKTP